MAVAKADLLGGGGADMTQEAADLAMEEPDLAVVPDLAIPPDLSQPQGSKCLADGDCRAFSSYCATAPCVCMALGAKEMDPVCNGPMVKCLIDPCDNKSAVCVAGTCQIK